MYTISNQFNSMYILYYLNPTTSVMTMITYECSGILVAFILVFLMCIMLCNIYSLADNHGIAILISVLLTRVLKENRVHLLRHGKTPKGKVKAYI